MVLMIIMFMDDAGNCCRLVIMITTIINIIILIRIVDICSGTTTAITYTISTEKEL